MLAHHKQELHEKGYTVVDGRLTEQECACLLGSMLDGLHHITCGRVKVGHTFEHLEDLLPSHHMLLQHFGVAHMQWVWDIRQHPAVAGVFADIWGCAPRDLITSMEGVSVHLPRELRRKQMEQRLHASLSEQPRIVQGTVHLLSTEDAAMEFLEGSHKLHAAFAQRFGGLTEEPKTPEERAFFDACPVARVRAKAGSIVLWDARTMHRETQHLVQPRVGAHVCMVPRSMALRRILKKRRTYFERRRTTLHEPHECKLIKLPVKKTEPLAPVPSPRLTPLGLRLVGFGYDKFPRQAINPECPCLWLHYFPARLCLFATHHKKGSAKGDWDGHT